MPSKRYAAKKRAIARSRGDSATAERPSAGDSPAHGAVSSIGGSFTPGAKASATATMARPSGRPGQPAVPLSVKYSYVPSELKRVAVMAAVMFALLIVLSFVFN